MVVDHAVESAVVAGWPGTLWRVVVLDAEGVEQASPHARYTRAVAVRVVERLPAARLFGDHGEGIAAVLAFAARLDIAAAPLAGHRHPDADRAYSRAFRRWLDRVGCGTAHGATDLSGTLAARVGPNRSPVNYGLSVIYRAVWERSEAIGGPAAFLEDDEGERVFGPPWDAAAAALLDTAMALGAPAVAGEDAAILTAGWEAGGSTPASPTG